MRSWLHWIEPWFLSYGLLGIVAAGLTPILLPQLVAATGTPGQVGLVMASLSLGGLTAPAWGKLGDRGLHKWLLLGGLAAVVLSLALVPRSTGFPVWSGLAFLQGAGITAVSTAASLLVVGKYAKSEWDQRMGALMTVYGTGQVVGLLVASFFAGSRSANGLYAGAFVVAAAGFLALVFVRPPYPTGRRALPSPHPMRLQHVVASAVSTQHHLGHVSWAGAKAALHSPFATFLLGTLLFAVGSSFIFVPYPLLFQSVYHLSPSVSSTVFSAAAAVAIFGYPIAGRLSHARGSARVWRWALAVRSLSFSLLAALAFLAISREGLLASAGFFVTVNSWPLIAVTSTVLATRLAPVSEGEAMGLYNAAIAVANTAGALLVGLTASSLGYRYVPVLALALLAAALAVSFRVQLASQESRQA